MRITRISDLYGRQVNRCNVEPKLFKTGLIKTRPAIKKVGRQMICQRCGGSVLRSAKLPHHQYYCPTCINLGRVSTLNSLCSIPEPNHFAVTVDPMTWHGHLTSEQAKCSGEIIRGFRQRSKRLLWAVTGAGKTEMLFPGIRWALRHNYRIGIASPRVDVCLELYPRLRAAFKRTSLVLLHGHSKQKYRYTQMVICTTHQLLRFYHAFDLLIIDEVDAFPFRANPPLKFAVRNAVKSVNSRLYLTATPDEKLLRQVRQGKIAVSYLPLRFHRHLLPEIEIHLTFRWRSRLTKKRLPALLIRLVKDKLKRKIRFLLFVPHVRDLKPVSSALNRSFNSVLWTTVYSQDPDRLAKVKAMRRRKYRFLITTTILERGVTFPGIDVIILGADDAVFSMSSLVQIAGRVGRKRDRPDGDVDFLVHSYTKRVVMAQQQIKHLNYLGAKLI